MLIAILILKPCVKLHPQYMKYTTNLKAHSCGLILLFDSRLLVNYWRKVNAWYFSGLHVTYMHLEAYLLFLSFVKCDDCNMWRMHVFPCCVLGYLLHHLFPCRDQLCVNGNVFVFVCRPHGLWTMMCWNCHLCFAE